jgi:hypothetical protein
MDAGPVAVSICRHMLANWVRTGGALNGNFDSSSLYRSFLIACEWLKVLVVL